MRIDSLRQDYPNGKPDVVRCARAVCALIEIRQGRMSLNVEKSAGCLQVLPLAPEVEDAFEKLKIALGKKK